MLRWLPKRKRRASQPALRKQSRRFSLEPLEERLLLSTDLVGLDYEAWREQSVSLDGFKASQFTLDELTPTFESGPITIQNSQATQLIGANQVWANYGYTGSGYSVAVLDTGVDYTHPNLSSQYVTGWDFVDNDADPMDEHGHGTHVAGTIASNHSTHRGVGSDLGIIALRVLGASGSGSFGDIEDALQWVVDNAATYNIVAVNMSLGTGNFTTNPWTFLDNELLALESLGVFVASASGNSFYSESSTQGLGFPSISPYSVSVGAVWDGNNGSVTWSSGARDFSSAADRITSFTQRSSALDVLAPGAFLTSTAMGGGFTSMGGTSMATPVIAAAAALLHQALDVNGQANLANQDYILSVMQQTGVTVVDGDDEDDNVTNTGLSFQRVDLAAAVASIAASAPNSMNTVGLFASDDSMFFLRDDNASGPADSTFHFGPSGAGWTSLAGDWNGDGNETVGLYSPGSGNFYLSNNNQTGGADTVFRFGPAGAGWVPLAGDWDGDGDDSIGLFDPVAGKFFLKNDNTSGAADQTFRYGPAGANWLPLAGDWDGDGTDTIGLFRFSDSMFLLSNTPQSNFADLMFRFGPTGSGWTPVTGDWDAEGSDSVGLFDSDNSRFFLANSNQPGAADLTFRFGPSGANWSPLAGYWNTSITSTSQGGSAPDSGVSNTEAGLEASRVGSLRSETFEPRMAGSNAAVPISNPGKLSSPKPKTGDVQVEAQEQVSEPTFAESTSHSVEFDEEATHDVAILELLAEVGLEVSDQPESAVPRGLNREV